MSETNPIEPELILDTGEWIRPLARRLLFGDEHAADDLIQEAWLRALASPPRDAKALRAWIRTAVRNIAHHVRRGEKRRRRREELVAPAERIDPAPDVVERLERQQAIAAAVLALREPYRSTVLHVFYDGLTTAAVAERDGVPEGTVRVRLRRALDQLRESLDKSHGGDGAQWMAALLPFASIPIPEALAEHISKLAAATTAAASAPAAAASVSAAVTAGIGSIIMSTKNVAIAVAIALGLIGGSAALVWRNAEFSRTSSDTPRHPGASDSARGDSARAPSPASTGVDAAAAHTFPPIPATSNATAQLRGRVMEMPDGAAVAHTEVTITIHQLSGGESASREARTDEQGIFTLSESSAFQVDRIVVAPGEATTPADIEPKRAVPVGEIVELAVEVTAGGTIRGVVVDENQSPVAKAEVLAWYATIYIVDGASEVAPSRRVVSAEDGTFQIGGVPTDFVLSAGAPGFIARKRWHGSVLSGGIIDGVVLELAAPTQLSGRVRDPDGAPVEDAVVRVQPFISPSQSIPSGTSGVFLAPPFAQTRHTDARGEFQFDALQPDSLVVWVHQSQFEIWSSRLDPGTSTIEITLARGTSLSGRIVTESGARIAGARVQLHQLEMPFRLLHSAISGNDGRFEIRGIVPPQECNLMVCAPGFGMHVEAGVRITESGIEKEISLGPAYPLAGRVIDAAGKRMAGVAVSIAGDRIFDEGRGVMVPLPTWENVLGMDTQFTGEDGSFQFDSLYDGEFKLTATSPGNLSLSVSSKVRAGRSDLVLTLEANSEERALIRGTIRDLLSGDPVTAFRVSVLRPGRDPGAMSGRGYSFQDKQGKFQIDGLEPGQIALSVEALGYSGWNGPLEELAAGDHEVDVQMSPARTLRFRVLDTDGTPIAKGRASFSGESPTNLMVEVGPGMHNSMLDLDENGEGVAVGLPAERIHVKIVYPMGRAAGDFEVDLRRERSEVVEFRVGVPRSHLIWAIVLSAKSEPDLDFAKLDRSTALREFERRSAAGEVAAIAVETNIIGEHPEFGEIVMGTLTPVEGAGYKYHSCGLADKGSDPVIPITLEPDTKRVKFRAAGHRERAIEFGAWEETVGRELVVVVLVRE